MRISAIDVLRRSHELKAEGGVKLACGKQAAPAKRTGLKADHRQKRQEIQVKR